MTDHDVHGCGRAGSAIGVLCAFLGMVCAGIILFAFLNSSPSGGVGPTMIIGVVGLFVGAAFFGKKAGIYLCEKGNDLSRNIAIGVALAFGSIATAIVTGMLAAIVLSRTAARPGDIVLAGFVVAICTAFFGGIPAVLLGALYGILITGELRRKF